MNSRSSHHWLLLILYVVVGLVSLPVNASAEISDEEFLDRLRWKQKDCALRSRQYAKRVMQFHKAGQMDSAKAALKEWRQMGCYFVSRSFVSPWFSYSVVGQEEGIDLQNHWSAYHFMGGLADYMNDLVASRKYTRAQWDSIATWSGVVPGDSFDLFVQSLASDKLCDSTLDIEKRWIYRFLSGEVDGMFGKLKSKEYDSTLLQKAYYKYGNQVELTYEYHLYAGGERWIPIGGLSAIGDRNSFSGGLGVIGNDFLMRFEYFVRFGSSLDLVEVPSGDTTANTNNFSLTGGMFSIGNRILKHRTGGLYWLGGIGADRLKYRFRNGEEESVAKLNLGAALWYQLFLGKYSGTFLGFQVRFNKTFLNLDRGDDISGNAVSIGIHLGTTQSTYRPNRHEILRRIEFFE